MKIYFAGAIRGGRSKAQDYGKIVKKLQEYGEVLTVHVANPDLNNNGEQNLSKEDIYNRDVKWLNEADVVIAEVSVPSLGVGYELGLAESLNKRVICFYDINAESSLSAMIDGDKYFKIFRYKFLDQVLEILKNELEGSL